MIECEEELSASFGSSITFSSNTTLPPFHYQTTATYKCEVGFTPTGGDLVRSCEGSEEGPGKWSGKALICEGQLDA